MKLRLQRSHPGRGAVLAAWRQLEETGLWLTESALGGSLGLPDKQCCGVQEERGRTALRAFSSLCMLSGNRTPPT